MFFLDFQVPSRLDMSRREDKRGLESHRMYLKKRTVLLFFHLPPKTVVDENQKIHERHAYFHLFPNLLLKSLYFFCEFFGGLKCLLSHFFDKLVAC